MSKPSKEELEEMYWGDDEMSMAEIAREHDVTKQAVSNWFSKYDIDTRSTKYEKPDDSELREWHHDEGMSVSEMADKIGCDYDTMRRWIHESDVELRPESKKRTWELCADPDCDRPGGHVDDLDDGENPPTRVDGSKYGVDGKLCRNCYTKRWRRRKRQRKNGDEADDGSTAADLASAVIG